jgi:hypothetical protein
MPSPSLANEHPNKAMIVLRHSADALLDGPAHRYHDGDRQRGGVAAVRPINPKTAPVRCVALKGDPA